MRLSGSITLLLAIILATGCKSRPQDTQAAADSSHVVKKVTLDSRVVARLAVKGIVPEHVLFHVSSPDSRYVAVILDSVVRFGPGDEMWIDELPSNWYGVRNRTILYLYDPSADTLHGLAQCEEVVNFYDAETFKPVQPERKEDFKKVLWSQDSKRLLLLKDRTSDALADQDALIFTLGEDEPSFLDLFGVWRQLMKAYPGARGTQVEIISWVSDSAIKIIFSIRGMPTAPRHEFIFDVRTGKPVSTGRFRPPEPA